MTTARSRHYQKRGGGVANVALDEALVVSSERGADLVALDDALEALAAVDARKSQVVEMRFFGGLSVDETAEPEPLLTYAMARWAMGHPDDSLHLVRRARHMDPLSPIFMLTEADYLFYTGELDAAAALYLTVINAHEDASRPCFGLAEVRRAQERFDEAIAARTKGHELEHDDANDALRDVLSTAKGEEGYRQIERTALRQVELRTIDRRVASQGYASPLDFARAYAQLDDTERAFGYLKAALDDHAPGLVLLNVDRAWGSMRGDPRFQDYVNRVGLPVAAGH